MAYISHLRLRHFRNYTSLERAFAPGLNLLTGENGQGKSNLLEAVHYLSLLRSFRTRKISDLKQWNAAYFFAEAELAENEKGPAPAARRLSAAYRDARRLRRDGAVAHRASEFINAFLCVPFVPEDIGLINGGPAGRRRFLDIVLSQLSRSYLTHLNDYMVALKARNAMLRESRRYGPRALAAYEKIMAEHGGHIIYARHAFIAEFATRYREAGARLSCDTGFALNMRYCLNGIAEHTVRQGPAQCHAALAELLTREQARDIEQGQTRCGPHRDELLLLLDGRPLAAFGSEGQCRTAALALRLTAAEHLSATLAEAGVVLLVDDVLGELDRRRQAAFFAEFRRAGQVFMACTEIPAGLDREAASIHQVAQGKLLAGGQDG